jgi:hypothetical protein
MQQQEQPVAAAARQEQQRRRRRSREERSTKSTRCRCYLPTVPQLGSEKRRRRDPTESAIEVDDLVLFERSDSRAAHHV